MSSDTESISTQFTPLIPRSETTGQVLDPDDPTLLPGEVELLREIRNLGWTAHNIQLTPRVWTLPGHIDFLNHPRIRGTVSAITQLLGTKDLTGVRIADLGCLEGGYSLALALAGADVVGIEGRKSNLDRCELLRKHFKLSNLAFRQDDVRNFTQSRYGQFDVVLAYGLLYHLDTPVQWIHQAAEVARHILLIDTMHAPDSPEALGKLTPVTFCPETNPLGDIEQIEWGGRTYQGRRWLEYPEGTPPEKVETMAWSSIENSWSFWLTRNSLYECLHSAGFSTVGERLDIAGDSLGVIDCISQSRSFFVGVKSTAYAPTAGTATRIRTLYRKAFLRQKQVGWWNLVKRTLARIAK